MVSGLNVAATKNIFLFSDNIFFIFSGTLSPSNNFIFIKVYSCGPNPSPQERS